MLSLSIPFQFPFRSEIQRVPKSVPNQFSISSQSVPTWFPISSQSVLNLFPICSHVVPNQFCNSFIIFPKESCILSLFHCIHLSRPSLLLVFVYVRSFPFHCWKKSKILTGEGTHGFQQTWKTQKERQKQREKRRHREKNRYRERQRERSLIIWRWDWKQNNLGCKGCL